MAADICVLFTAADAHLREYEMWCPGDVVASEEPEGTALALDIMRKSMSADVRPTSELPRREWLARADAGPTDDARAVRSAAPDSRRGPARGQAL